MGKAEIEIKFPCGFEYKTKMQGFGLEGTGDTDLEGVVCPLHGKKCKK